MNLLKKTTLLLTMLPLFASCDFMGHVEERAAYFNNLEDQVLALSKENRSLQFKIAELESQVRAVENEKDYLDVQLRNLKKKSSGRSLASVKSVSAIPKNLDLVKFDVYEWKPNEILAVAEKEFNANNFEKSAQFFKVFSEKFVTNERYNDQMLFQAAIASYESGKHYDWSIDYLNKLVTNYPTSKFYRGAKLWMALSNLKMGNTKNFFDTVEEFRKKYRNTNEWKVLSAHYEKIVQKHK